MPFVLKEMQSVSQTEKTESHLPIKPAQKTDVAESSLAGHGMPKNSDPVCLRSDV